MSDTLWLLPARGGSKGVPGKNLKRIGGITLIEWKVRAARAAGAQEIVVSSDNDEILTEAARLWCSTIKRPDELATDTATTAEVIKHALDTVVNKPETVVLLEPSAPFTQAADYTNALTMLKFYDADLVVGMKETAPHTSFIGDVREDSSVTPIIIQFQRHARRRQDYPRQWTMNGALYVFRAGMFKNTLDVYGGSRNYGLMMDRWRSIEIDTPEDLELAEYAYDRGHVRPESDSGSRS